MMSERPLYYDRDGKPMSDVLEWGKLFEDFKYKRVKATWLWWGGWVSTVWLGLDHSFGMSGPPLIFESMAFKPALRIRVLTIEMKNLLGMKMKLKIPVPWLYPSMGSELDQDRYATLEEARNGHRRMVLWWSFLPSRRLQEFARKLLA